MRLVKRKRIIEELTPFNGFYIDCKHSALSPLYKFKGIDPQWLLMDIAFYYEYNKIEKAHGFVCRGIEYNDRNTLLNVVGILEKSYEVRETNLINEVKRVINDGKPLIVRVDLFYQKVAKNAYHSKHQPHHLLIYGYDDFQETVNVIDHIVDGSPHYDFSTMSYDELKESYLGYLMNYFDNGVDLAPTFRCYEFAQKEGDVIHTESINILKKVIIDSDERVTDGLESLRLFVADFNDVYSKEEYLAINIKDIVNQLNDICIAASIKLERTLYLLNETHQLYILQSQVNQRWKTVRTLLAKYLYSNKYQVKSINKVRTLLEELCDLEIKYHIEMNRWSRSY